MTPGAALRLHDVPTGRHVIVEQGRVYADRASRGRISRQDEAGDDALGVRRQALIDAASFITRVYDPRLPGGTSVDRSVVSGGTLNAVELAEFGAEGGTPAER